MLFRVLFLFPLAPHPKGHTASTSAPDFCFLDRITNAYFLSICLLLVFFLFFLFAPQHRSRAGTNPQTALSPKKAFVHLFSGQKGGESAVPPFLVFPVRHLFVWGASTWIGFIGSLCVDRSRDIRRTKYPNLRHGAKILVRAFRLFPRPPRNRLQIHSWKRRRRRRMPKEACRSGCPPLHRTRLRCHPSRLVPVAKRERKKRKA
ncbi:hypothetical protein LX32DRAFT_207650 [Colletotrichum zoysiae]|uniref:Transmembrane protein n=1 Tax=Colletotrichum zoysiae TaxID=1216348 RepID=A0AAD9HQX7_9PEZI|nr:hypothetical protein LX32DRAFT_207650 [Colletotrichum zoysiae]